MKYRISKYNPKYRDIKGSYIKDEWTDYSDIGRYFDKKIFTVSDYQIVELNLLFVLYHIFLEKKVVYFEINAMENSAKTKYRIRKKLKEAQLKGKIYNQIMGQSKIGDKIDIVEMLALCQLVLRNCLWSSIVGKSPFDEVKVDFGWDYYVYVSCTEISDNIVKLAEDMSIYIEIVN